LPISNKFDRELYWKLVASKVKKYGFFLWFYEIDDFVQDLWIARQKTSKAIEHLIIDKIREEYGHKKNKTKIQIFQYGNKIESFDKEYVFIEEKPSIPSRLLKGLNKDQRKIVRMYFEDEMSMEEIGKVFNLSLSGVHVRIKQILKKLRLLHTKD
jgi:RNA polymerase sigma factor (sigma-70 family)